MYVFGRINGKPCKFDHSDGCDAFLKLFVNDELVLVTPKLREVFTFDAKITFTTGKIRKNSKIKIEVWHMKRAFWDTNGLIQSTEGDIESYLNEPIRQGHHVYKDDNHIETISFWRDEFV